MFDDRIERKRMIIIDIKNRCIIDDYFIQVDKEKEEKSVITSNWNSGYSIACTDKDDMKKEVNDIIDDYFKEIEENNK